MSLLAPTDANSYFNSILVFLSVLFFQSFRGVICLCVCGHVFIIMNYYFASYSLLSKCININIMFQIATSSPNTNGNPLAFQYDHRILLYKGG